MHTLPPLTVLVHRVPPPTIIYRRGAVSRRLWRGGGERGAAGGEGSRSAVERGAPEQNIRPPLPTSPRDRCRSRSATNLGAVAAVPGAVETVRGALDVISGSVRRLFSACAAFVAAQLH